MVHFNVILFIYTDRKQNTSIFDAVNLFTFTGSIHLDDIYFPKENSSRTQWRKVSKRKLPKGHLGSQNTMNRGFDSPKNYKRC